MNLTKAEEVHTVSSYFGSHANYFPSSSFFIFYQTCSSDFNLSASKVVKCVYFYLRFHSFWDSVGMVRHINEKVNQKVHNYNYGHKKPGLCTKITVICGAEDGPSIRLPRGHGQKSSMESLLTELYPASCGSKRGFRWCNSYMEYVAWAGNKPVAKSGIYLQLVNKTGCSRTSVKERQQTSSTLKCCFFSCLSFFIRPKVIGHLFTFYLLLFQRFLLHFSWIERRHIPHWTQNTFDICICVYCTKFRAPINSSYFK